MKRPIAVPAPPLRDAVLVALELAKGCRVNERERHALEVLIASARDVLEERRAG